MAAIGIAYGSDGPASAVVALVLAPVAVALTWRLADRLAGPRFANLAAAVYVLLPGLAALTMLGTYRSTFLHRAVPNLVGLRGTPWFVLGLAIGAAALFRAAAPVLAVVRARAPRHLVGRPRRDPDRPARDRVEHCDARVARSGRSRRCCAQVAARAQPVSRAGSRSRSGWPRGAATTTRRSGSRWLWPRRRSRCCSARFGFWCRRFGWRLRRRALAELELEQRERAARGSRSGR